MHKVKDPRYTRYSANKKKLNIGDGTEVFEERENTISLTVTYVLVWTYIHHHYTVKLEMVTLSGNDIFIGSLNYLAIFVKEYGDDNDDNNDNSSNVDSTSMKRAKEEEKHRKK